MCRGKIPLHTSYARVARTVAVAVGLCVWFAAPEVRAQLSSLAPLRTESTEPVRVGVAEVTLASAYFRNERFPMFTIPGVIRTQDRLHLPTLRVRVGVGSRVEIHAQHELIYLDETTHAGQRNWQYGTGDARLHTKVLVKREEEWLPAFAVRFGTKLPNASRENRLGTDETDFDIEALTSKNFGSVAVYTNLGIVLLGNPGPSPHPGAFSAGGQDDLFSYSLAVASRRGWLWDGNGFALRVVTELQGLAGSRFGNDRMRWSIGARLEGRQWTYFLGSSVGLLAGSEDVGVLFGVSRTWELDRLFRER